MFHHRMPTSTVNVKNAAHPFSTKDFFDKNYVLIHNGVLFNEHELKRAHEKLGIVYSSTQKNGKFNDSEALLWDVALYLEGKQDALKAEGSIAFVCMALEEGNDKLYFARNNGSPLNLQFNKKRLMLSSEGPGKSIETNKLHIYDYAAGNIHKLDLEVPTYHVSYNKPYTSPEVKGFPNSGFERFDDTDNWAPASTTPSGYYDHDGQFHPYGSTDARTYEDDWEENELAIAEALDFSDPDTFEQDIKEAADEFLNMAGGYYSLAIDMIDEDYERIKNDGEVDTLNLYELQVLGGAKMVLFEDPFWIGRDQNVQHPRFEPKKVASSIGSVMLNNNQDIADAIAKRYQMDSHLEAA